MKVVSFLTREKYLLLLILSLSYLNYGSSFQLNIKSSIKMSRRTIIKSQLQNEAKHSCYEFQHNNDNNNQKLFPSMILMISTLPIISIPSEVLADDYGLLTGRSASLLHPITMFALLGTSFYSAYLGLQWKRLRTIGETIKSIQTAKEPSSTSSLSSGNIELTELIALRKNLLSQNLRDKHFFTGASLLLLLLLI